MGASNKDSSDCRAVIGVYAAVTAKTTTERNGVFKLLQFLFNGWKTFLRSVLQQKEENADEFKQISTTLNYYTIVRKIHVLGFECLPGSWSDRDDSVKGRM